MSGRRSAYSAKRQAKEIGLGRKPAPAPAPGPKPKRLGKATTA